MHVTVSDQAIFSSGFIVLQGSHLMRMPAFAVVAAAGGQLGDGGVDGGPAAAAAAAALSASAGLLHGWSTVPSAHGDTAARCHHCFPSAAVLVAAEGGASYPTEARLPPTAAHPAHPMAALLLQAHSIAGPHPSAGWDGTEAHCILGVVRLVLGSDRHAPFLGPFLGGTPDGTCRWRPLALTLKVNKRYYETFQRRIPPTYFSIYHILTDSCTSRVHHNRPEGLLEDL